MSNHLEEEIREVLAHMEQSENEHSPDTNTQTPPDEIQDIYVLIVREHGEVEEDQPQIVESEPAIPQRTTPLPPPFDYVTLGIVLICCIPMLASIILQVYMFLNPAIATVTIIPKSQTVTITGTLQMGRLFNPITISQSQTVATTGRGHQIARAATGTVTFYNGLFTQQFVASGTVYTGQDGVEIVTTEDATIPPGNPSSGYGTRTVTAQAVGAGSRGNIQAEDINITINNGLLVRNNQFHNGQDERNFQTVSKKDIENISETLKTTLAQSVMGALQGQGKPTEQLYILPCNPTVISDHRVGDEAIQVKVTVSQTCSAVAYNREELEQKTTDLLMRQAREKLGTSYSLFGGTRISVIQATITPPLVFLSFQAQGTWVFALNTSEQERIKNIIAGKTTDQALQLLAALPGIRRVAIAWEDGRLPKNSRYIHFSLFVV